jgi:phage shock protein PspC (stress-responsive transcriptional regulator)
VNPRRLYRCRHDRRLAGVAAGMAEYLEIDPTVVRILWILSVFLGGFTILLYIILAFVIPNEPVAMPAPGATGPAGGGPPTEDAGAEPTGDQPTGDQPTGDQPTGDQPTGDQPTGQAWAPSPAWTAPTPARTGDRRGGGAGLYGGLLLVIFGAIALATVLIPGWVGGAALGPALLLALGIALLLGSTRRAAYDR